MADDQDPNGGGVPGRDQDPDDSFDDTDPGGTVIQLERPRSGRTPPKPSRERPGPGRSREGFEGHDPSSGEWDDEADVGEAGAGDEDDLSGGSAVVVGEVHPRLIERRDAIASETERRRAIRRIWVLAAAVLVVDGLALVHSPLLDVDEVTVTGSDHVSAASIAWASGIDRGDALVTLDGEAAEERIEALPWVAAAEVVRDWDGTVRMSVRERQPAAVVQTRGDLPPAIVDAEGRVLEVGGPVPPGLVVVTGAGDGLAEGESVPAGARDALRIALDAPRRVPGAIVSVSTRLEALLASGARVRFGSATALEEKMVALATVLSRVDMSNVDVLDLGVPGNPTVTRH
jgi:cell division protein FtsQ